VEGKTKRRTKKVPLSDQQKYIREKTSLIVTKLMAAKEKEIKPENLYNNFRHFASRGLRIRVFASLNRSSAMTVIKLLFN